MIFRLSSFILILSILFCTSGLLGQSSATECENFSYGDFILDGPDQIYIHRDFMQWQEFDDQNRVRNIFDIAWIDDCTFNLIFSNSSAMKKTDEHYMPGDTIRCTIISTTGNAFRFRRRYKNLTEELQLVRTEVNVMDLIETRDRELKKELRKSDREDRKAFGKTPDSLKNVSFSYVVLDSLEIRQMQTVKWTLEKLGNNEYDSIYFITSTAFKTQISADELRIYLDFVSEYYGKIESFTVFYKPLNYKFDYGPMNSMLNNASGYKYILETRFDYVPENCLLTLVFKAGDVMDSLAAINIVPKNFTSLKKLDTLGSAFFNIIKTADYNKLFLIASDTALDETSFNLLKAMMSDIAKAGEIDSFNARERAGLLDPRQRANAMQL